MSEELKYKVSIETDQIDASELISPAAIDALAELNKEIEGYRAQLRALKEIEKSQGELTADQAILQERLKGRIKETSGEYQRQQRELVKMESASKTLGTSYNDLVKQNSALSAAMRQLPLNDTTGELQKLQAAYNANNDVLKQFDKAVGNNQRNVGNYESALNGLGGVLSGIPGPVGDIIRTFQQLQSTVSAVSGAFAGKETVIKGFTASTAVATTATSAHTTAEIAQAGAVTASAGAIGFDTNATTANTVATTGNTTATVANATAQTAQAGAATASAAAIGTTTIAQRALNLVMKANPVLLLVAAFASLVSMLTTLQPVMNNIERITTALGTAFNYVRDTVYMFINGIEDTRVSLRETIAEVDRLTRSKQVLNATEADFIKTQADARRYISGMRLEAKDETLSIERRTGAMERAIAKENEMVKAQIDRFQEEARTAEKIQALTESTDAERVEAANAYARAQDAITNSNNRQRELFSELNTLRTKGLNAALQVANAEKAIQKEANKEQEEYLRSLEARNRTYNEAIRDEFRKTQEAAKNLMPSIENSLSFLPDLEIDDSRNQAVLANAESFAQQLASVEISNAQQTGNELLALDLQQAETLRMQKLMYIQLGYSDTEAAQMALTDMTTRFAQQRADAELSIEQRLLDEKIQNITNFASIVTSLGTAVFGKNKAIAIAQAIIDTYAAANSAMKSTPGGPLAKGIAVAAVIARGLANVRAISSTNIGSKGGGSASGGSIMSSMTVSGAGTLIPTSMRPSVTGVATDAAASMTSPSSTEQPIYIEANLDQSGLALAVRRGESNIRSQQFTYT